MLQVSSSCAIWSAIPLGAFLVRIIQPVAKLRKLSPDPALFHRRVAGETLRELARDYGVSHTSLSRYFARPQAVKELKRAAQLNRVEERVDRPR
jgi:hypothetical protein